MTTEKQRVANRANSRRSTGPRTGPGKALVRLNPLKHGLRSPATVIPGLESQAEWEQHRATVVESLSPVGALQEQLAERAAGLIWRLRRVERFESLSIAAGQAELQVPRRPKSDRTALDELLDDDQDSMTDEEFLADREASINEAIGLKEEFGEAKDPADAASAAEELAEWQDDARTLRTRIALTKAIAAARKAGVGAETADRVARYEAHLSRELSRILDQLDRLRAPTPPG